MRLALSRGEGGPMQDPLFQESERNPQGFRDISPLAALPYLGAVRVVDVREPEEYVGPLGHLQNADLIPLATVSLALAEAPRSQPILVVCRSGGRSARAAAQLVEFGFQRVYNLMGGMLAWDANQLPVSRAPAEVR